MTNDIYVVGKRQAKKYIRKALSFGVRSGYLIPTDRQGNVLRVCPTLDTQSWRWRPTDTEARQKRRIARRGKAQTTNVDRRAMRRGIPRDKSLQNVNDGQTASKRRYRTRLAQSPAKSLHTRESKSPARKSPDKSLRERNKPKTFARKNKLVNLFCFKRDLLFYHKLFIILSYFTRKIDANRKNRLLFLVN